MVRARSVPHKKQKLMPDELFRQDPRKNVTVVRTCSMRPSRGMEIYMLHESRTLSHTLNFKRKMIASTRVTILMARTLQL